MKPVIAQPIVVEMNSTKFRPTCVAMFSGLKSCCKIKEIHRILSCNNKFQIKTCH